MCTNRRYIINSYGDRVLVNCGYCKSCLQEKAVARTNRIRNNHAPDQVCLFFTLTYRNCCMPYFDQKDLDLAFVNKHFIPDKYGDDQYHSFKVVPVYRDVKCRRVRKGRSYKFKFKDYRVCEQLSSIVLPYPTCDRTFFKYLRNSHSTHVGVCYYPDLQNFIKNLRQYSKRHISDESNFSFYTCSEYGPDSCRPHFHGLLYVSERNIGLWKKAIASCWPYDNHRLTYRNIEIAINASSYVSSYVNCDASVPEVLKTNADFKPKHSYSQGFGLALEHLSLVSIFEAYKRGDLTCRVSRIRKGVLVVDDILLPKYALSRWFPKIKGYSRLTSDALQSICERPQRLSCYARDLSYSSEDLKVNQARLRLAVKRAVDSGLNPIDYSFAYSRIWSLRSSQVLRRSYEEIKNVTHYFQLYDNIADYFRGAVLSPTLDDCMFVCPPDFHFETDYNKFDLIVEKSRVLSDAYDSYSKDRKVRNHIYSQLNRHM